MKEPTKYLSFVSWSKVPQPAYVQCNLRFADSGGPREVAFLLELLCSKEALLDKITKSTIIYRKIDSSQEFLAPCQGSGLESQVEAKAPTGRWQVATPLSTNSFLVLELVLLPSRSVPNIHSNGRFWRLGPQCWHSPGDQIGASRHAILTAISTEHTL